MPIGLWRRREAVHIIICFQNLIYCGTPLVFTMKGTKLFYLLVLLTAGLPNSVISQSSVKQTLTSAPQVKPLPTVWKEEYEAGNVRPGDHTQHMLDLSYCETAPDRIYMAQDVCNVWASKDFGQNWFTIRNQGLLSPFIISVEVDPLDKNRVLAAAQCRYYDGVNLGEQGIYLSTDGGITWTKKISRTELGEVRSSTKLITYAPTSKDKKLGYAKRWYAAFGEYKRRQEADELNADDGLLYSDNGGQDWKEVRKLPASVFGDKIRGIKVHTVNQEKLFVYGNRGLYRFDDATSASGGFSKMSGNGGLPEGDIWGRLYQSPDGKTLLVAVNGKGIYKSVNEGAAWTLLHGWNDISYCYVNENFPDKIFAVPSERSNKQIRVSSDGGKTWVEPADNNVQYRPGYERSNWIIKLNGQFTCVIPDPRNVNNVFIHTKSKNFKSTDGGLNWSVSDNGFNGASHSGINNEQMFDPVNPDRFCYFMVDKGVIYSDARGKWFHQNTVAAKEMGLGWKTTLAGALHPTEPVILASAGKSPNGKLIRSADNGKTWKVVSNTDEIRWVIAFDLADPNYCYQWRERSNDGGLTWTELRNMPPNSIICGVSRSDGRVIYAMDCKGSGKKVWRSTDRGDTWQLVIDASWDLTFPGPNLMFVFRIDPQNPNIVYTSSSDGNLSKWDFTGMPAKRTDISVGNITEENFFINRFAIDPRHPSIMYAVNLRANTGNKIFRTIDGGISWQNISDYIPEGSVNGLAVSPVTGEVFISSQNGSLVMLPPYETSNTAYEAVPYKNNHLTEPYN